MTDTRRALRGVAHAISADQRRGGAATVALQTQARICAGCGAVRLVPRNPCPRCALGNAVPATDAEVDEILERM